MNVTDIYMAGQVGPDTLAAVQLAVSGGDQPDCYRHYDWQQPDYWQLLGCGKTGDGALPVPAGAVAGTAHGNPGGAGYSLWYLYPRPAGYISGSLRYRTALPAALPDYRFDVSGILCSYL